MTTAVLCLPAILAWTGDVTTDNLTVSTNAAIYGKLDFYSSAGTADTNSVAATGGTITMNGNYRIHTFTNNGTFAVNSGSLTCDVLVVAGGGGGGGGADYSYESACAGGGGAGGILYVTNVVSENIQVVVGIGGAAGTVNPCTQGQNGSNSSFGAFLAYGGGGGGGRYQGIKFGKDGGSGGGAAGDSSYLPYYKGFGYAGPPRQGYDGGTSLVGVANGSGGGGAGGNGQNNASGGQASGGLGMTNDISGSSVIYAIGGSGGCNPRSDGASNTGNGGDGGKGTNGKGGSGIVIVRYAIVASSNNDSTLTISSNGISQANASGTNVFMGKVGIGTNNPAEKLHVAGNVQVDGSLKLGDETRTNWPNVAVGALIASNNLSDVTDPATARANLGLGSAATNDAGVFLTPTSDGSQLTNITATQVGALSTNSGALIAANNLSDLNNAGTARANLGLGSAATNQASAFLSTTGGVVNGSLDIQYIPPKGDLVMGSYTNQ